MVASALALSLIGLGAVRALPTGKTVEERQGVWIGPGSGVFIPGDGGLPPCLTDKPLIEQPPCLLPPIPGEIVPGKKKREVKKRQVIIGDPSGIFIPGQGDLPICLTDTPLNEQPPCFLPPIPGEIEPGKKREVNKRQLIIGDPSGIFIPGQGDIPICLTDIPLNEQPPCMLPPIVGGLEPPTVSPKQKRGFVLPPDASTNPKKVIESLEKDLIRLQNKPHKTKQDLEDIEAIKAALLYLAGITNISAPPGTGSTFTPGKRGFVLPPDATTNPKKVIESLELDLIRLQNKPHKTKQDLEDIEAIKAALLYLAGITNISAPPGTGSTFTPGKRGFVLPPDATTNPKKVIETLELDLIRLQNKPHKTKEDLEDIEAIKAALLYLAGITKISAPPGTGSTFTPGKRDSISLDTVGTYASECPNLEGAEIALQTLMHKDKLTVEERIIKQKLEAFLKGCGITIVKSPDGTWTIIKPSDKRDVGTQLNPKGLQDAYFALMKAASEVYPSQPSFANWLAIQQISGLLEIYGVSTTLTVDSAGHPKRQTDTITVGSKTCQLADVMGLRAALAALLVAYGEPSKAPVNIFLVEQVIVTALQLCGQSVAGWTTIIPGSPIPGGPMIPDPTVPGGPLIPDPTVPGGEIKPSDRKRQAPVGDPAALLAALKTLEEAYGTYGSGKIPVPVWLIMVNIVTILQTFPGVVVPGWPVLGQGSVVLTPST
jgi:hypothetical protein